MTPDLAFIALALVPRLGSKLLQQLLGTFSSAEAVIAASPGDLLAVKGIGAQLVQHIQMIDLEETQRRLDVWQGDGVDVVTQAHPQYPPYLAKLPYAPAVLFMKGTWQPQKAKTLAIVGTREASTRALKIAYHLGQALAQEGWTIVSGLARGVDSAAHRGALGVVGGQTVAVMGTGHDYYYPPENEDLALCIMQNGATISEFAPEVPPQASQFVTRNRLITGISQAVVMVEAGEQSAMHAVRFAVEQGRPVFVVDLPSVGNRRLIQEGKYAILSAEAGQDGVAGMLEQILAIVDCRE